MRTVVTVLTGATQPVVPGGSRLQTGPLPAPASGRRQPHRSTVVIASGAVLGALWLGLTAPSVSPVAGPPPITTPAAAATGAQPVDPRDLAQPPAGVQPPGVVQQFLPGGRGPRGRR